MKSGVMVATIPLLLGETFDDEFTSFDASGSGIWTTDLPFWGSEHTLAHNNESEYYTNNTNGWSPFSDANGILTITAEPATIAGANPLGLPYDSGAITTYNSFSQLYGYFQVTAKLPSGQGLWPAFWLLPTNFKSGPELDVFEVLGNQPSIFNATVHSAIAGGGISQAVQVANTSTAFHTYGVDWEPKTTTFYMDGVAIASAPTPADMNVPMYMLLNLAVGGAGSWPGAPSASTSFPAGMEIDSVQAFATANTVVTTNPSPPVPAPLVLPSIQASQAGGTSAAYVFVELYGNENAGTPQAGIGVTLLNALGQIVQTGVTNASGYFTFGGLAAGTYQVRYILPQSFALKTGGNVDPVTGVTTQFTLTAGETYGVPYQLVTSAATLSGNVTLNNVADPGVTVDLLNAAGIVVQTTLTHANGQFNFWAAAGSYSVRYDHPANTALDPNSLANTLTGETVPIALAEGQALVLEPENMSSVATLTPAIKIVTGNSDGGATLAGTSEAGSTVTVADTVGGVTTVLGTATTASNGNWSLTSHAMVKTTVINSYTVSASDSAGNIGSMPGKFILASTGNDRLTGTTGVSDVFAIMSFKGSDVIDGFMAGGATHDYIDLSGRGVTSFSQVQSITSGTSSAVITIGSGKTITLTGVAPSSLTAADFRFS